MVRSCCSLSWPSQKRDIIQVSFRNLLDQAQQLSNRTWVSRDEIGFEGQVYTHTKLTLSIGHKKHSRPLTTTYLEGGSYSTDQKSWCRNCEKSSFNSRQTINQLISRQRNLHTADEVKQYYQYVADDEPNEDTDDFELITSARQKKVP